MNHFFYNPPHSWQEAIYWPAKTPGTWQFWEKIAGVYSLFTFSGAKENRLVLEVDIIVLGLWWESPGSQLANTWPLARSEVDCEKKMVYFAILRENHRSLPSWKAAQEKWSVPGGKYSCLGSLMRVLWVPAGWYMTPHQEWGGLRKKWFIWLFWERISGLSPLWKRPRKMGLFRGWILNVDRGIWWESHTLTHSRERQHK